jgi:cob(I)alamin adenosyltransferase
MKIYTKTGDSGNTGLIGGTRVPKNDIRIEAYGTVDELNAFIGLLASGLEAGQNKVFLKKIQFLLFAVGSHLATDQSQTKLHQSSVIREENISEIEKEIDRLSENLPPLNYFVLPGDPSASSTAHVCRTITRRAERRILELKQQKSEIDNNILVYINRLSDYFFVLSRYIAINEGFNEFLWKNDI